MYNKSRCFDTFPFPDEDTGPTPDLRQTIASLAEQIDRHRKRVLGDTLSKLPSNKTNKGLPASPPTPLETLGRDLPGADFWAFDSMRPTDHRSPPQPWPATLPEQVKAVAHLLTNAPGPLTLVQIESTFTGRGAWKKALPVLLETLVALGRAQQLDNDGVTTWGNA